MTHYQDSTVTLHHGDCLDVLRSLPDASVDSVVTDPPYGLEFMGKEWDAPWKGQANGFRRAANPADVGRDDPFGRASARGPEYVAGRAFQQWCEEWARECLRVLKPGGHLLAFGGTRTWHRLACAVEDAGFEVRDSIAWLYGSGFPKSLDVSKAIDKAAGAEREVVGIRSYGDGHVQRSSEDKLAPPIGTFARTQDDRIDTAPATPDAERWQGWGTALKPAHEPVVHGVKPYSDKDILAKIGSQLDALEDLCRRSVSAAARSSAPTQVDSPEARTDSAHASAATQRGGEQESETQTGAAAGSSVATAMSASEWTAEKFSSTVTSWKACWAELWEAASTSTTSTATSRTTDLQTLSSCLSSITQSVTATSTHVPPSSRSLVTAADNLFAAGVLNLRSTLALSAIESATSGTRQDSQDAAGSKPAFEPVVVARKPLVGTVAGNVLTHGTGALNIDATRIGSNDNLVRPAIARSDNDVLGKGLGAGVQENPAGRWPANVVLDESQAEALDEQSGTLTSGANPTRRGSDKFREAYGDFKGQEECTPARGVDVGGASRFFYVAKADASERPRVNGTAHPTVKPLALMRWLVRLVTPPGGVVLEPFAGSGTTVEACIIEGFHCIAIEKGAEYLPLIEARIARRRDPVRAIELNGEDMGLFDFGSAS